MARRPDATSLVRLDPPIAPPWVSDALAAAAPEGAEVEKEGVVVETRVSGDLALLRMRLPEAAALGDAAFRSGVARCYVTAAEILASRDLRAVRIWNYVPAIRRPSEDGFSRYEVFNAGRQRGYDACLPPEDVEGRHVTSSAVGHRGRDLVVHLLASARQAVAFENPRQRPAYLYSRRYGMLPPCFARASRIEGGLGSLRWRTVGLVAGTASIVGEDSRHPGDLEAQLAETLRNLAAVGAEVAGRPLLEATPDAEADTQASLARYRELRVYLVREGDAAVVERVVRGSFPNLTRFDLAAADLCRPELLVEAEGILRCDD